MPINKIINKIPFVKGFLVKIGGSEKHSALLRELIRGRIIQRIDNP
jgi:hypothetical protein